MPTATKPKPTLQPNPATKLKPNKNMIDIRQIEATSNPDAFKTSIDLGAVPQFNQYGDNIDPVIRSIATHNIDEYAFNPRQADNDHFEAIKESIKKVGLQQRFSVVRNPQTKRYTLIKGGNTRLLAFKELYRETGDVRFSAIDCIVEPWDGELNKTQAVIAHLIENEARGELILVDKAKALIELERDFRSNLSDEKDSDHSSESLRVQNYNKIGIFVEYLKNNGYSVSEKQLGLFRFTAIKLVSRLDRFLNQGIGSPQIIKIRGVYNNLKRIIKDFEVKDYSNESLDDDFFAGLQQYNKTRSPFDFDRLLDVLITHLIVIEPFASIRNNNHIDFKKELLNTRKPKPKVKPKDEQDNSLGTGDKTNNIDTDNTQDPTQDIKGTKDDKDANEFGSVGTLKPQDTDTDIQELDGGSITEPKELNGQDPTNLLSSAYQDAYDADNNNLDTDKAAAISIKNPSINPNPLDAENNHLNTKHRAKLNPEAHCVMHLDFYRKQAISLVVKISNKLNINKTIKQINTGCGFLLVDLVDKTKDDFEHWGVWWLLLGYSHGADLLNPIPELTTLGVIDVEINTELLALYAHTNIADIAGVDSCLEQINQLSKMYEFRSPNLQSVKDKLVPHLWQDITELEAVCYQIMRIVGNGPDSLWD